MVTGTSTWWAPIPRALPASDVPTHRRIVHERAHNILALLLSLLNLVSAVLTRQYLSSSAQPPSQRKESVPLGVLVSSATPRDRTCPHSPRIASARVWDAERAHTYPARDTDTVSRAPHVRESSPCTNTRFAAALEHRSPRARSHIVSGTTTLPPACHHCQLRPKACARAAALPARAHHLPPRMSSLGAQVRTAMALRGDAETPGSLREPSTRDGLLPAIQPSPALCQNWFASSSLGKIKPISAFEARHIAYHPPILCDAM
ncbi:hypothetical protein DFH09DRAFT_1336852 [Mycena vulgaris]|nr:hypothetical protein DFH09DRAFT_1336852 [Mycena vulgaris]